MYRFKAGFVLYIWSMIILAGCATSEINYEHFEVYNPKAPVDITSHKAAIKDLAGLLENRPEAYTIAFQKQYFASKKMQYSDSPSQIFIDEVSEGKIFTGELIFFPHALNCDTTTVGIRDDMIEVSFRLFITYADLLDLPIRVQKYIRGYDRIYLGDEIVIYMDNIWNVSQRVADDLIFIQRNYQKYLDDQSALFEKQATQYRSLAIKPEISEELRRYIVQANAANQNKEYGDAIRQYQKAVELDPVSYPEAYFNLALLSAQGKRYKPAIRYMKQYLALVPEATDARSAQDKIYEWEFMLNKK
jgi:tetratricopeptide (TPR) repeat protein